MSDPLTAEGIDILTLHSESGIYSLYAKGHHDPVAFLAACREHDGGDYAAEIKDALPEDVSHHHYRWVPSATWSDFEQTAMPAKADTRGAFAVTEIDADRERVTLRRALAWKEKS